MRASCHHRQGQQPRRCAACAASGAPQRTERRPGSPGTRPCSPDDGRTSRCVARPAPPTAAPRARRLARALPPTSRGRAASGEIPGSSPVPGGRGQPPTQPWTRRQRRRCRCRPRSAAAASPDCAGHQLGREREGGAVARAHARGRVGLVGRRSHCRLAAPASRRRQVGRARHCRRQHALTWRGAPAV